MTYPNSHLLISVDELAGKLSDPALRLFDTAVFLKPGDSDMQVISGRASYNEGHIPGAAFLDIQDELSVRNATLRFTHLPFDALVRAFANAGISDDSEVVFYASNHPMWATRAWWLARYCGLGNCRVLDGGLAAWQASGREIATKASTYPVGVISSAEEHAELWADQNAVRSAIANGGVCTVNALPEAIYTGEAPISYGRAGHISGSVNVPFDALAPNGNWTEAATAEAALAEQGALSADQVITYCGGGIAATLTAFTLHLLGRDNVAVYDGSMQDWAADADNPVRIGAEP